MQKISLNPNQTNDVTFLHLVNTVSGNDLLPDDIEPLPEPMLTIAHLKQILAIFKSKQTFPFKKIYFKVSSGKWRSFCWRL